MRASPASGSLPSPARTQPRHWLPGDLLLAPNLIVAEVCNVACLKLRRSETAADQAAAIVENLPDLLDELVPSAQPAPRAFAIASALSHSASAYDRFYLALAERRGALRLRRPASRLRGLTSATYRQVGIDAVVANPGSLPLSDASIVSDAV
jgi:predicted nucleic acid-binding protein